MSRSGDLQTNHFIPCAHTQGINKYNVGGGGITRIPATQKLEKVRGELVFEYPHHGMLFTYKQRSAMTSSYLTTRCALLQPFLQYSILCMQACTWWKYHWMQQGLDSLVPCDGRQPRWADSDWVEISEDIEWRQQGAQYMYIILFVCVCVWKKVRVTLVDSLWFEIILFVVVPLPVFQYNSALAWYNPWASQVACFIGRIYMYCPHYK